jgi:hypothetical protein
MNGLRKSASNDIEIRTFPQNILYHWELSGNHNLKSVLIHNISIINNSDHPLELQTVSINILEEGTPVQTQKIRSSKLNSTAQYLHGAQKQGVIDALDFVFRPDIMFGEAKTIPNGTSINPGESLFLPSQTIIVSAECEKIRITVDASYKEQVITESLELPVAEYKQKNDHRFPLEGTCYVSSGADLFSEHRWVGMQEFGYDLVRLSGDGGMYSGSGRHVEDYYGYNSEILASASGVVVKIIDEFLDSVDRLPREGESNEEYFGRLLATSSELLVGDPYRGAGNYVLIQHPGGEFSLYGHLKPRSVCVEKGDRVEPGAVIGRLGHSGNSPFPHLHFHVCNGEDFMYARSLPVQFSNISILARPCLTGYVHTGDIIKVKE